MREALREVLLLGVVARSSHRMRAVQDAPRLRVILSSLDEFVQLKKMPEISCSGLLPPYLSLPMQKSAEKGNLALPTRYC